MINTAILQTEQSIIAAALRCAIPGNPILAAGIDGSSRETVTELLPACSSRANCVTLSAHVLRVAGPVDMTAANCNLFRKTACAAWHGHTDVEIDLSHTAFIDCAGLGALIAVRNLTQARNGVARLMNPASSVQQMLDLTRTAQLFEIVNAPAIHN
jgi:anti-anti-sigma factor